MTENKCRICHGFGDAYHNESVDVGNYSRDKFVKVTCPSCRGFGFYLRPRLPDPNNHNEQLKIKAVENIERQFLSTRLSQKPSI